MVIIIVHQYDLLGHQQEYIRSINYQTLHLSLTKVYFVHHLWGSQVVELYVFVIVKPSNVVPAFHVLSRQVDGLLVHYFNAPFFSK